MFSSLEFDSLACHPEWMNHEAVYDALMARALRRDPLDGYVERHHIKPKSLFPELRNDPDNLVILSAREHFVAHLLLAKMFGGAMMFAAQAMSLNGRYGSRSYAWLREGAAAYMSEARKGSGNPMFGKKQSADHVAKCVAIRTGKPSPLRGRILPESHRQRIAEAQVGRPSRSHSQATRDKISHAKKGKLIGPNRKRMSEEQRRHLSEIHTGKTMAEDVRQRISASLKGRSKPPRSEDHVRRLAEANRKNGELAKARNLASPSPSSSMIKALEVLFIGNDLSTKEISERADVSPGTMLDALRRLETIGWVSVEWKKPAGISAGRGSNVRRHYSLTPEGLLAYRKR